MGLLTSLLPPITAGTQYLGSWDASTNTPELANGVGQNGNFYMVSVSGTVDFGAGAIVFTAGDTVIYNGSIWQKIEGGVSFTPENVANKDTSGGYPGLTALKINFKNAANTVISFFTNTNTIARTYTFQDRDGTIADNTDLGTKLNVSGGTLTGALNFKDYVTVASASTCDIGAATSNNVAISGTTSITSFGTSAAGVTRRCRATGAFLITYNGTSLITRNGKNIVTKVDDCFTMVSLGSGNWLMTDYSTSDARILAGPINTQTGTTYTFALTDIGATVTLNNASSITATVPLNSSVAFPIGTQIDIIQLGAGKVTFSPAGGVTISSLNSVYSLAGQYSGGVLKKISTDTWVLMGALVL